MTTRHNKGRAAPGQTGAGTPEKARVRWAIGGSGVGGFLLLAGVMLFAPAAIQPAFAQSGDDLPPPGDFYDDENWWDHFDDFEDFCDHMNGDYNGCDTGEPPEGEPPEDEKGPTDDPEEEEEAEAPFAGYVETPRINREMGFTQMGTLHERVGERQTWAWDDCGERCSQYREMTENGNRPHPFWGRLRGNWLEEQGKDRFGHKTRGLLLQLGTDLFVTGDGDGDHNHTGVMFSYSHGSHRFYDKDYNGDRVGRGHTDMFSLGGYSTWYRGNGTYVDLVGNLSWLRNRYKHDGRDNKKQHGYGLGLSVEVGRPWQLGDSNWLIEPQAQLLYQYIHLSSFDDNINHVHGQSGDGLRGRVGARLAWNDGNDMLRTNTFYGVANIYHDFTGSRSVAKLDGDKYKAHYRSTWAEVGIGGQFPLSQAAYFYGDVRYERSLSSTTEIQRSSSTGREGYSAQVGLKYSW